MSIDHLLDHVGDVWRLVTEQGDVFGETINSYERVYTDLPLTFQRRNTVIGTLGPGQVPSGDRRVYLDIGPEFRDRDVIAVTAGPAGFFGPQLLEVESMAAPRGHHIELRCSEFSGQLPEEEGS